MSEDTKSVIEVIESDLEKVISEWKKDSKVDTLDVGNEILRIPNLHSKYLEYMTRHSIRRSNTEKIYDRLHKLKWRYYTGKIDEEELKKLGWEPFNFLLKSDINIYMNGDLDIIEIKKQISLHDEIIRMCESILKELHSRTFQLKSYIEYEKFIHGQG
jgi:hypothetical protein